MRKIFLAVFIFAAFTGAVISQHRPLRFNHLSTEDGLSQNSVVDILQDRNGFLWFATHDGLNKYDGYRFTVYEPEPGNPHSVSDTHITAIHEDSSGVLRFGTRNGGLNRWNPGEETFTRYPIRRGTDAPDGLPGEYVTALCEAEGGDIWIGTLAGLSRLNRKPGEKEYFTHYLLDSQDAGIPGGGRVGAVYEDRRGTLWVGTFSGFGVFDRSTGTYHPHPLPSGAGEAHRIRSILEDREGVLWLGAVGDGVYAYRPDTGDFTRYANIPGDPRSLSNNLVRRIHEDRSGVIRIGTAHGLNRLDRRSGTFTRYFYNQYDSHSLSGNYITAIHQDRGGVLWVGTLGNGLNKLDSRAKFDHYKAIPGDRHSLSGNHISAVCEDRFGILWVGIGSIGNEGLDALDRRTGKITHYRHIPNQPGGLGSDNIVFIFEDQAGAIWIGSVGAGPAKFNRRTGTFTHYRHIPGDPRSFPNNIANHIYEDGFGELWIGSLGRISKMNRETGTFTNYPPLDPTADQPSDTVVTDIHEPATQPGILWLGTLNRGLFRFDTRSETMKHYAANPGDPDSLGGNDVETIYEDRSGVLWIGTYAGGLNKVIRREGDAARFIRYTKRDGLPNNTIYGILEDADGRLWMSTNKGLSRFDPKTGTFRNYNTGDGLQSDEFNVRAYHQNKTTGEMFFGGPNGLNAFFPSRIKDNPHVPPIVFTRFQLYNMTTAGGGDLSVQTGLNHKKEIRLSYKQNTFSFEFAALDFAAPQNNTYAVKLEGLHRDWISLGAKHDINITGLKPGSYRLRVKGANNDGAWNEEGASIKIIITPPFWQTPWFRIIALFLFALLSYTVIHLARKYLRLITFWKKKHYVGHYRIVEQIGSGGMGTVYKAKHMLENSKTVAVKVIREELARDETQKKRLLREAVIIDQLDHPHIVKIIERGEHGDSLFIAMEYLDGRLLSDWIKEAAQPPLKETLEIMSQLTDALDKMHEKGIVHRDLKPENVMLVNDEEERPFVKVLDFGLARTGNLTRLTESGILIGTVNYLAPEYIAGMDYTSECDVYALGVIFYEMVTGQAPFKVEATMGRMREILDVIPPEPRTVRDDVPEALNYLITRLLDKDPDERPDTEEILETLAPITDGFY